MSANAIEQKEEILAVTYEIIQQMNYQMEARVSTMEKLMKQIMIQNEKLMITMVKQPLGGSGGGGGDRGGDGSGISKILPRSQWKVRDKHPYNGKILRKCKHCRNIDSHADNECLGTPPPNVLKNRKAQMK